MLTPFNSSVNSRFNKASKLEFYMGCFKFAFKLLVHNLCKT